MNLQHVKLAVELIHQGTSQALIYNKLSTDAGYGADVEEVGRVYAAAQATLLVGKFVKQSLQAGLSETDVCAELEKLKLPHDMAENAIEVVKLFMAQEAEEAAKAPKVESLLDKWLANTTELTDEQVQQALPWLTEQIQALGEVDYQSRRGVIKARIRLPLPSIDKLRATKQQQQQANPALIDPYPQFPNELKALKAFVTWKGDVHDKQPYISGTMIGASYKNPDHLVTYQTALENLASNKGFPRLGIVPMDGYVGLDLDSCVNPQTGEVLQWAKSLTALVLEITATGTYTHFTPSGTGLRVWLRVPSIAERKIRVYPFGSEIAAVEGKDPQVEVLTGRYATMDGGVYNGAPSSVAELTAEQWQRVEDMLVKLEAEHPRGNPTQKSAKKSDFQADPGFALLQEEVGWDPFLARLDKMEDTRFHNFDLSEGKVLYCPMPGHGDRGPHIKYTQEKFGLLPGNSNMVHCIVCNFTGDLFTTVRAFDGGEEGGGKEYNNYYEVARQICSEHKLDYNKFFPIISVASVENLRQAADDAATGTGPASRVTASDIREQMADVMAGRDTWEHAQAAEFFEIILGRNFRYVTQERGTGEWYKWNGHQWAISNPAKLVRMIQTLLKKIRTEIMPSLPAERGDEWSKWRGLDTKCSRADFLEGTMKMLRSRLLMEFKEFDTPERAHLVNFLNGTYDLEKQVFRQAEREDYLTQSLAVTYCPAKAGWNPTWHKFFQNSFPDKDVREFLHKFFGYMLEGTGREKVAIFFHGYGDNGKTALVNVLMSIFGYMSDSSYGKSISWDSVSNLRDGAIRNDLARLHNARAVFCDESQANMVLNENTFKSVVGMSLMTVRFLHKEFFSFKSRFAFVLATNRCPRIIGGDDATWKRVLKVPMTQRFVKGHPKRIENLDALLAAEREAIVLWLIEGYRKYKTEGLTVPAQIAEASSEYRQNSDITEWFFNENVNDLRDSQPDEKTKFEEFYDRYALWCKQKNEKEQPRDGLMDIFRSRGYSVACAKKGLPYVVHGASLIAQAVAGPFGSQVRQGHSAYNPAADQDQAEEIDLNAGRVN